MFRLILITIGVFILHNSIGWFGAIIIGTIAFILTSKK